MGVGTVLTWVQVHTERELCQDVGDTGAWVSVVCSGLGHRQAASQPAGTDTPSECFRWRSSLVITHRYQVPAEQMASYYAGAAPGLGRGRAVKWWLLTRVSAATPGKWEGTGDTQTLDVCVRVHLVVIPQLPAARRSESQAVKSISQLTLISKNPNAGY